MPWIQHIDKVCCLNPLADCKECHYCRIPTIVGPSASPTKCKRTYNSFSQFLNFPRVHIYFGLYNWPVYSQLFRYQGARASSNGEHKFLSSWHICCILFIKLCDHYVFFSQIFMFNFSTMSTQVSFSHYVFKIHRD